jgi:hypothetical protein
MWSHPLYVSWRNMLARCEKPWHPEYNDYGGRGIWVCEAWHDIEVYIAWNVTQGWFEGDSLECDRKDNDGPYIPENCHRVTDKEQSNNRRGYYTNISGVCGVKWNPRLKKWEIKIRDTYYGIYDTLEEAETRAKMVYENLKRLDAKERAGKEKARQLIQEWKHEQRAKTFTALC